MQPPWQVTFVLAVHGQPGRFVFMADQWDPDNLGASRYQEFIFLSEGCLMLCLHGRPVGS